jgi:hypothetical protein
MVVSINFHTHFDLVDRVIERPRVSGKLRVQRANVQKLLFSLRSEHHGQFCLFWMSRNVVRVTNV